MVCVSLTGLSLGIRPARETRTRIEKRRGWGKRREGSKKGGLNLAKRRVIGGNVIAVD